MGYALEDIEKGLVEYVIAELPYLYAVEALPSDFIDKVIAKTEDYPIVYVALNNFSPFRYTENTQNIQVNATLIAMQCNYSNRDSVNQGDEKAKGVLEIVDDLRTAFTNRWATLTDLLLPFQVDRYDPLIHIEHVSVWGVKVFATDRFQLPVIS
jgi:hypothetical protein